MASDKSQKLYTDEQLDDILNKSGLSEISSLLPSESENETDNVESETLHDSESDKDYEQSSATDVDSDESDEIELHSSARKRQRRRTSTPQKRLALPYLSARKPATGAGRAVSPAARAVSPSNSDDYDDPAMHPDISAVPPAVPATSRGRRTRAAADDDDIPRRVEFGTTTLTTRSGFRWNCHPQTLTAARTTARNIMPPYTPGPTQEARSADTPEKAMNLLFDDEILNEIVQWTNHIIPTEAVKSDYHRARMSPIEPAELRALLGILIFSGCQRDNHLSAREMFSPKTGPAIYRAAMSEDRFSFLVSCLRFDDKDTREERRQTDKFAAIRKIWDVFIENCGKMYVPHEQLTVDEQLLGFRGNCPFRLYIPSKPKRYGLKLVLINDSNSKYMLGAIPYLGRQGTRPNGGINLGHYFTKELTKPYHKTNRNVTTDNWFTSVALSTDLLINCGMTHVGTVRSSKKEIPWEMKDTANRRPGSSAFLFTKDITSVSYCKETSRKKKKLVHLMSTMHTHPVIMPNGKPEIINFYNENKGGVDTFDQMCSFYAVSRKTKRWPMCVFYGMINYCVINSWIIYNENHQRTGASKLARRTYMQELAVALIKPWAEHRLRNTPRMSPDLKKLINTVCSIPVYDTPVDQRPIVIAESRAPMVRCALCLRTADRKTRHRCTACGRPVCPRHICPMCVDCQQ